MESALYDPAHGFYASGTGQAGRRGDFLTSVEVGPLFAAVLARALDAWWEELGQPERFTVIDAGAGVGTLARGLLAAQPRCLEQGTLVAVERSAVLAARHPAGGVLTTLADLPPGPIDGVIVANELLDNLAFRIVERSATGSGWDELWVGPRGFEARPVAPSDLPEVFSELGDAVAPGTRLPVQDNAAAWVGRALGTLARGRLVCFDYGASTGELAARPDAGWLRTYVAQQRGSDPLVAPGSRDITADVAIDQLPGRPKACSQAEFLHRWGIAGLVEEGKRVWADRAHLGDLAAIRARSRVAEAAALTDPAGLGAFSALIWTVGHGAGPDGAA